MRATAFRSFRRWTGAALFGSAILIVTGPPSFAGRGGGHGGGGSHHAAPHVHAPAAHHTTPHMSMPRHVNPPRPHVAAPRIQHPSAAYHPNTQRAVAARPHAVAGPRLNYPAANANRSVPAHSYARGYAGPAPRVVVNRGNITVDPRVAINNRLAVNNNSFGNSNGYGYHPRRGWGYGNGGTSNMYALMSLMNGLSNYSNGYGYGYGYGNNYGYGYHRRHRRRYMNPAYLAQMIYYMMMMRSGMGMGMGGLTSMGGLGGTNGMFMNGLGRAAMAGTVGFTPAPQLPWGSPNPFPNMMRPAGINNGANGIQPGFRWSGLR